MPDGQDANWVNLPGLFTEHDKNAHIFSGFSLIMLVFALLTRYDWAFWLFVPALLAPVIWEIVTHPKQKGSLLKEDRRDIIATWIGSIFGLVAGYLVFVRFW